MFRKATIYQAIVYTLDMWVEDGIDEADAAAIIEERADNIDYVEWDVLDVDPQTEVNVYDSNVVSDDDVLGMVRGNDYLVIRRGDLA